MIWEVDEDCDGLVNWPEFQAMWQRCREDKAGALHRPFRASAREPIWSRAVQGILVKCIKTPPKSALRDPLG